MRSSPHTPPPGRAKRGRDPGGTGLVAVRARRGRPRRPPSSWKRLPIARAEAVMAGACGAEATRCIRRRRPGHRRTRRGHRGRSGSFASARRAVERGSRARRRLLRGDPPSPRSWNRHTGDEQDAAAALSKARDRRDCGANRCRDRHRGKRVGIARPTMGRTKRRTLLFAAAGASAAVGVALFIMRQPGPRSRVDRPGDHPRCRSFC